jgi:DNA-binding NarL/FixJ family response regulator
MSSNGGTVVIADGDRRSRAQIVRALSRAGYRTIDVATAADALEAARRDEVRLVMLEVERPDLTGYEACRELRDEHGDALPIFFVSGTRTDAIDRVAGLLLGADDFIVKPFDRAELVARVRRFVGRRAAVGGAAFDDALYDGSRVTGRERQILVLLAHGKRQKEIAQELSISPKTVATHIQNLLRKLDAHSRAELVARAWTLNLAEADGTDGRVTRRASQAS